MPGRTPRHRLADDGPGGHAWLEPFRTYGNDPRGRAYARSHGIILVGCEPPGDHVVPCAQMLGVAGRLRVPVAPWRDGPRLVQLSEPYRP